MPNFEKKGGVDDVAASPSPATTLSAETQLILDVTPNRSPGDYDAGSRDQTDTQQANRLALECHPNSLAPINQLPPEILATVFELVKGEVTRTCAYPVRRRLSWMAPTKVCRVWRAIALDTTSLWSTIDFVKPEIARLMLHRSKNALFDMQPLVVSVRSIPILRQALSHTPRWRSINVGATTREFESLLSTCIGPAPCLEALTLFDPQYGNAKLPRDFLKNGAPSLKNLDLYGFDLGSSWTMLPFSATITNLSLKRLFSGTLPRPPAQQFFDAMQRMPFLRRLRLEGILPLLDLPPPTNRNGPFPTFSSVTEVNVFDQGRAIDHFAHLFYFPNCTHLTVSLEDQVVSFDSATRDIRVLARFLEDGARFSSQVGPRLDLHSLAIRGDGDNSDRDFGFWLTFQRSSSGGESEKATIEIHYDPPDFSPQYVLPILHTEFDMSGLRALEVFSGDGLPQPVWQNAFVHLKSLAIVHFNDTSFRAFFTVLDQDPSLPKSSQTPAPPDICNARAPSYFPALTTIKFSHIQFEPDEVLLLGEHLKQRPASWNRLIVRIEKCGGFAPNDYHYLLRAASISWDRQPE